MIVTFQTSTFLNFVHILHFLPKTVVEKRNLNQQIFCTYHVKILFLIAWILFWCSSTIWKIVSSAYIFVKIQFFINITSILQLVDVSCTEQTTWNLFPKNQERKAHFMTPRNDPIEIKSGEHSRALRTNYFYYVNAFELVEYAKGYHVYTHSGSFKMIRFEFEYTIHLYPNTVFS